MMLYRLIVYSADLQYIECERVYDSEKYAIQEAISWDRAGYIAVVFHGGDRIY